MGNLVPFCVSPYIFVKKKKKNLSNLSDITIGFHQVFPFKDKNNITYKNIYNEINSIKTKEKLVLNPDVELTIKLLEENTRALIKKFKNNIYDIIVLPLEYYYFNEKLFKNNYKILAMSQIPNNHSKEDIEFINPTSKNGTIYLY